MNVAMALPEARRSVSSLVLWRLRHLRGGASVPADTTADVVFRPYSFLTECECPDDCLRDHENE